MPEDEHVMPRVKIRRKPLPVGTKGHARHYRREYTVEVISTDDGIGYRVGRSVFSSLSAAGKSITGYECNGWVFWNLHRG
jgi:hypothetical protein